MTERAGHVIGIDGGGTGCRVAISAANGTIISCASGGSANYTSDPDGTVRNIFAALSQAADKVELSLNTLLSLPTHLGLAGIMTPRDAEALKVKLPFKTCQVSDDQITSTIGAFGERNGALVAVGTGSFLAFKRGEIIKTIGGWGLHLGDQASGAWLGRAALQRVALVADGMAQTSPLVASLFAQFNSDHGQMIAFARDATPADYAQFAPSVFDAANENDPHALDLIDEGAAYLRLCLASADLAQDDVLCMTGGLGALYAPWLNQAHQVRLAEPLGTALDGALHLARRFNELA